MNPISNSAWRKTAVSDKIILNSCPIRLGVWVRSKEVGEILSSYPDQKSQKFDQKYVGSYSLLLLFFDK